MPGTANSIITPQTIKSASAVCTAAKTTFNDSTNAVKIVTAGANGSILYGLKALARATVTATKLQLYRSPDNGTTMQLINTATMAPYTMTNTDNQAPSDFGYTETVPLRLGSSDTLWVATAVALSAGIVFDAQYEDL